jgi:LuxR family maltose regulon positive regulatory protein
LTFTRWERFKAEVETSILITKLFIPPAPPELVRRPRLLDKIQAALNHKLTLVSAPAGFGKTTLLSEWIRNNQPPIPTAWLSLEEADSDPRRFWEYIIAALRKLQPDIGGIALDPLQAIQSMPVEYVLTTLANDLAGIKNDSFLVLDDYHFIQSEPVHSGITFLLEHLPPCLHLVIATRADPPLPIARLRGKGTILEIGADDLRFTVEEAAALLTGLGVPALSSGDIEALNTRAEGWVVGLKMAMLSMHSEKDVPEFISGFTGTQRYIMDYLIEEVLQRQSSKVRDFLLKTSVLERLNGPLCDAVTGSHDGQETLIILEKANLFLVPLDESRQWYRYEQLFAELLRHRLEIELGSEKSSELHRLASGWHEGNGFLEKAIDHALAARDWEKAVDLVMSKDSMAVYGAGIVHNWLRKVPQEVLRACPMAYLIYAWTLITTGQFKTGAELLDNVEKSEVYNVETEARIAGARMVIASFTGDPYIEEYVRKVRSLRPDDILAQMATNLYLGFYYVRERRFNEAEPLLNDAYTSYQREGLTMMAGAALMWLGIIALFRGELRQAEQMLKQSLGVIKWNDLQHMWLGVVYHCWNDLDEAAAEREKALASFPAPSEMGSIYLYTAAAGLLKGDIGAAAEAIEKAEKVLITEDALPEDFARVAAYHVTLAIEKDNQNAISQWLDKFAEYEGPFLYDVPTSAIHLLYERWGEIGRERLQVEYEHYHKEGYQYLEMGVRLHQALLSTDPNEALAFLVDVLVMGEPEGNIRILADSGPPILPLLRRAIIANIEPDFARKIIKIIESEKRQRQVKQGKVPPATRLLTGRELEVLCLMADGLSNPQIARRLVISLDTAKTHVHHVLDKLEADSRVQAIARARDLDLL